MMKNKNPISTPQAVMEKALELLIEGKIAQWIDLMDEDIVFEFPFAPSGYPTQISGRKAVFEHFKDIPSQIKISAFTERRIHQTTNPEMIVVEFGILSEILTTPRPYNQRYICVVEMRGDKIIRYRDYWNPITLLEALGANGMETQEIQG